jgi:hypothetical protein
VALAGFAGSIAVNSTEYHGDGLDRVQDPQGVLFSKFARPKDYFARPNFGAKRTDPSR